MSKNMLWKALEARTAEFERISDAVWDTPELCFREFESTKLQREFMAKEGFRITTPVAGMDTAFIAECGSGKPIIALLGENDALAGQSQQADVAEARPIVAGGNGHACGHNLLGTAAMEAACALKSYMEAEGLDGTVRYYACPAEEGGGGKVFMARAGVFDDVDAAFAWHPGTDNTPDNAGLACVTFRLRFEGKAAHAAGEPWSGRSALDAAELMNIGVQFLREHMTPDARIHYSFMNVGGTAPNVVQREAELCYCVRAARSEYMEELYERVLKISRGAAMMTETEVSAPKVVSAYNSFLKNDTLDRVVLENLRAVLPVEYTAEELEYARRFQKCGTSPSAPEAMDGSVNADLNKPAKGSTDVADVSWCVPIGQARVACAPVGSVGHGWTTTAVGKSAIAHKGMHAAAKMLSGCAFDLLTRPELVKAARADRARELGGNAYHTLTPESLMPGM